jgi:hypothetical protein
MKKTLALFLTAIVLLAAGCGKSKSSGAPDSASVAAKPAAPSADEAPPSLETPSVLQTLRDGDPANILEVLKLMTADREGWAEGGYGDLIRPLWNLFVRQAGPEADPAAAEIRLRVSNLFNFGDWYPILEDLLLQVADRKTEPAVRQAAAEHLWRFAAREKAGLGPAMPAADRPRVEKTVLALLDESDDALAVTAAQAASALGLKPAGSKMKAILARAGDSAEARSLKYAVAEALFGLDKSEAALAAMRALVAVPGDFSEEAAEFLKKNGAK